MLQGREMLSLKFEVKTLRGLTTHLRGYFELGECFCEKITDGSLCGRCAEMDRIDKDLAMIGAERGG